MKPFLATSLLLAAASASAVSPVQAQGLPPYGGPYPPPFVATLSNNIPLAYGMSADEAAAALGVPLNHVRGNPGNEIFLAFRDYGGSVSDEEYARSPPTSTLLTPDSSWHLCTRTGMPLWPQPNHRQAIFHAAEAARGRWAGRTSRAHQRAWARLLRQTDRQAQPL